MSRQRQVSGVFPHLTAVADMAPNRTETGIGALMPWAGRLWFVTYVAHTARTGSGTGLFSVDADFRIEKHPESMVGTYANRIIHSPTHQLLIGPHVIDTDGNVRTIREFSEHRLAATMEHPTDPATMALYLTMEGVLFEVNVETLQVTQLFDLLHELDVAQDAYSHFKGGHVNGNRIFVTNNTYEERDFLGNAADGRLGMFDGSRWQAIERKPFCEVTGRSGPDVPVYATGWDNASAILKTFYRDEWTTYRLPKATHTFDHMWYTEWPRIREVETERFLLDTHFMFYELPAMLYDGKLWGVRPISTHLRMIPDFCSWRGLLVLAGNQVTPIFDSNPFAGEPQSNLWFGKTDDLWAFGKPAGWGGPWWKDAVQAETPSDPFLMTGFDQKVLHLRHDAAQAVDFAVEVDFTGAGDWVGYETITVGSAGYAHHEFPAGFSAHWVRIIPSADCTATAQFAYT
ncbi:MAG: hypothetical protein WBA46_02905 [Thermomicrobiales bacterium]